MNRRGFLAAFSAGLTGLAIGRAAPVLGGLYEPERLLWTPEAPVAALPEAVAAVAELSLGSLTRAIVEAMAAQLPRMDAVWWDATRIGETAGLQPRGLLIGDVEADWTRAVVTRQVLMTHQLHVDTTITARDRFLAPVVMQAVVAPVAASLARAVIDQGLTVCGGLPCPTGVEEAVVVYDRVSGIALRGVRTFDCDWNAVHRLRFDLLAGRVL